MKKTKRLILSLLGCGLFANCTTTYDQYGNPVQSVDPGTAAVGIAAAGLIGAAIANNNNNRLVCHRGYWGAPACW